MLYSIQNSGGEVYGIYEMPATTMSPEVWAAELKGRLNDILGINGVRDVPLPTSDGNGGYIQVPRVVLDIDPWQGNETERVQRVHNTIGQIAIEHTETQD